MGSNPTCAATLLFSTEKEMFRFVVLPCFDLGLAVPMLIISVSSVSIATTCVYK